MDEVRPAAGPVVSASRVKVAGEAVRIGAPRTEEASGEPRIQLVREDGVVRAIEVICSCGEKIRILCEY